jgi:hypothetical protein
MIRSKDANETNGHCTRPQRVNERNAGAPVAAELENAFAAEEDRTERWGRRIGRTLGWIAVAFLLMQLLRTYGP